MHDHLFFERASQQLEIAISLICLVADFEGVDASEKFRMRPSYSQPPCIVADVRIECVECACAF